MKEPVIITIRGKAADRGLAYGRAVPERIRRNIDFYRTMFKTYGVSWEQAKSTSRRFEEAIQAFLPAALEEMRGIAEGAGVSYEDILAINCRSEILFAQPDGCSSLGVLPELSADGHAWLGQTWDWLKPARETTVIVRIKDTEFPDMMMCAEAGIVGGKGFNRKGIGVCLNALSVGHGAEGVPLHILYRAILTQSTISNALDQVAHAPRAGSGNFAISSAAGFMMNVEYTPENFDVLMPEREIMCHTNHFLSQLFAAQDTFKAALTDTFVRLNRMRRLAREIRGPATRENLLRILSDHANFPDSICSHEDPCDPKGKRLCTVYAVLMDLTDGLLWISPENPCEGGWTAVTLNSPDDSENAASA